MRGIEFKQLLEIDQQEIENRGRSYGGGLDKVEPNELKRVLLPVAKDFEFVNRT